MNGTTKHNQFSGMFHLWHDRDGKVAHDWHLIRELEGPGFYDKVRKIIDWCKMMEQNEEKAKEAKA